MTRLSICIATRNRSKFLVETVKCILDQITNEVEIVIVDGASTDDSKAEIESLNQSSKRLRYFYEDTNSGVDGDFDKSVGYALGKYCWLFSDDDLLQPNAISSVINSLKADPQLLVVNSSIHTKYFEKILSYGVLKFHENRSFDGLGEQAFLELAPYLSFIGAIVVERDFWLSRERKVFHGSAFAHIGVLFQSPLPSKVQVLAEPLIKIRYGNSEWAPRGFEIWLRQWPNQVLMLDNLSSGVRKKVAHNSTFDLFKFCLLYRAMGSYNFENYRTSVRGNYPRSTELILQIVLLIPVKLINTLLIVGLLKNSDSMVNIYRLANSFGASMLSKWIAEKYKLGFGMCSDLVDREK